MRSNVEIGVVVRKLREAAGMSQAELGRRVGVTQTTILDLEWGRQAAPILERLAAIGEVFDMKAEELMGVGRAAPEVVFLAEQAGWLAAGALHALWRQSVDPEWGGCCYHHCGPCGALHALAESGDLERILPEVERHDGNAIWDAGRGEVSREWLWPALTAVCETGCDGCEDCDHGPVRTSVVSGP